MTFDIDLFIVISFLVITLVVGLGQASKVTNIKEYALGGRNFSTGVLVATMVATWASGSGFFVTLSRTYQDGLYFVIAASVSGIQLLIMAFILAPRMGEFLGTASVAESMGSMYGRSVRVITAIAGTIGAAGAIAVQFKVFGNLVGYFTDIPVEFAIIVSGCIVTVYSAFGGIRAVTLTDIFQIFSFGFALPIIGIVIWNQLYLDNFLVSDFFQNTSASHAKFKLSEVLDIGNPRFWQMIPLIIYFMVPSMFPAIYQRMIMAKDIDQIKRTCLISAVLLLAIELAMSWIPFLIFNVDPNITPGYLPGYIINNYTYIGLKGLIIVGVIAMAMSTADSNINISSVFFAHDICAPLNIGRNRELLLSKIFSMFLGISAIGFALSGGDLFSIILLANSFYMPVVTVPLLISILGFRSSTLSVLISMAAGFGTVVIWRIIGIETDPIAFAMLMNIVFLFGSHYLLKQPGGWVAGKKEKTAQVKIAKKSQWSKLVEFNFIKYCKKYSPTNEMSYTGMGIYFIMYTITTMYTTYSALSGMHGQLILGIYQFMMVTGIVLAMYPIWPFSEHKRIKQTIAQIIWPVVIFVMFVFFNGFFVLMSEFKSLQFSVFSINMIITAMLFGWRAGLVVIVVGSYAAVLVHNSLYPGYEINANIGSPGFVVIYIMMMVGSVFLIFIKPKQEQLAASKAKAEYLGHEVTDLSKRVTHYNERISDQQQEIERLGATAQKILNNVHHELRLPVGNVMNFAEMLNEGLENYSKDQLKMLSDEVYKNSNRLSSMILNMLDLATLDVKKINLAKKTVNLSELIEDRVKSCRKIYLQGKPIDFEISIESEMLALVDANYIRQVIDNLVINAITFSDKGLIKVKAVKKKKLIEFTIIDQGKGIPKMELYDIFTPFKMGTNTESKAEGRGVGLALCKSAIEAHGGLIKAESHKNGAMFKFVLPIG